MNELSLVLQSPQEGEFLQTIKWNKEQIKAAVASITEKYENIVYGEEQIAMAKEDRAKLNKMRTALSDKRIQIKKELMKPYDLFEEEVKEVTALIDAPIKQIDEQVKKYEEEEKQKKKDKLKEYFDENVGELKEMVTFEKLLDKKWLNKSVSLKKATGEIDSLLEKIADDIELIRFNCKEDMVVAVLNAYVKDYDMGAASAEMVRLQHLADLEEQRLRDEAMKREREKKTEPKEVVLEDTTEAPTNTICKDAKQDTEKIMRAKFVAYGTKEQLIELKEYMKNKGIRISKE